MALRHPQATVRFAQFADTHIGRDGEHATSPDGSRALQMAVAAVGDGLDFVVHTGDIVSRPADAKAYASYRSLISGLPCPIRHIPGNHDDAALMAESLDSCPAEYPWALMQGGIRFIGLNSSSGYIADEQLSALSALLTEPCPAVLFVHHHICPMLDSWLNRFALENVNALMDRLNAAAGNVIAVIHGHIHHDAVFDCMGVPAHSAPALTTQFDPYGEFLATTEESPGFVEFSVSPEGILSRRVRRFR